MVVCALMRRLHHAQSGFEKTFPRYNTLASKNKIQTQKDKRTTKSDVSVSKAAGWSTMVCVPVAAAAPVDAVEVDAESRRRGAVRTEGDKMCRKFAWVVGAGSVI